MRQLFQYHLEFRAKNLKTGKLHNARGVKYNAVYDSVYFYDQDTCLTCMRLRRSGVCAYTPELLKYHEWVLISCYADSIFVDETTEDRLLQAGKICDMPF